ncbi:MAG: hybrid sensor histidine kinase/response regulator [Comamonadaceae bacterium SCN 68-20]|nr:MAG: hybrid sensor histidine kinase/response regulator [Comamonadaceae bacterium SCN 68-20]
MAIDIRKFIGRFVEEARDHLARLGEGLAALDAGRADPEGVNALFRSAHTIKGSSRMLRLASITEIAHRLEDVLGAMRDGSLAYSAPLGQLLYRALDQLADLVDRLAQGGDGASLPAPDGALCQALAQAAGPAAPADEAPAEPALAPVAPQPPVVPAEPATVAAPVPAAQAGAPEPRLQAAETVRVRLSKLDELIKLMGEVVSSHARMRERLADIHALERSLAASLGDGAAQGLRQFARLLKDDVQAQEALMDELHDKTLLMRMLPLAIVLEPAARLVRELARSVGKQVECSIGGTEIELDRQLIDKLSDPIIHLIRNAIDHGIELPAARAAVGKPAQGRLRLSARQDGGWVVIEVADDGGGIPVAAVREKAVKKGLLSAEKAAALSDQEAIDLIFLPGFSTSSIITDLSGRGVGMDVVRQTVLDELQGAVGIETRPGQGTTFSLRLPMSLAMMRVLLVQAHGLPWGFTAQHVVELQRVPAQALMQVAERQVVIVRNEFVPVVPLAELLRVPAPAAPAGGPGAQERHPGLLLVVLQVRSEKIAVQVDGLLDERDMVIKPLPPHLRKLPLVSGMVITGRNEMVNVLHAPALLEQARRLRGQGVLAGAAAHASATPYRVLVVDDSLNTREIEKDVLQAYGYHVTLAEDGVDGLRKAMEGEFDAILTDVEMPHMDGFTLTARLREEDRYRDTPIVIITSREKEEDKRRGMQVGADAYIVKGDFDQNNLVETLRTLLG